MMTVKWSFFVLALALLAALIIFIILVRGRFVRVPRGRLLAELACLKATHRAAPARASSGLGPGPAGAA